MANDIQEAANYQGFSRFVDGFQWKSAYFKRFSDDAIRGRIVASAAS
jgi:hypothetical protein